jgi:hypothetical protein
MEDAAADVSYHWSVARQQRLEGGLIALCHKAIKQCPVVQSAGMVLGTEIADVSEDSSKLIAHSGRQLQE